MKPIKEESVRAIKNEAGLFKFLEQELSWPLPQGAPIEELTFSWSGNDLHINESAKEKLNGGSVAQLRPMTTDQPWGIFLVRFNDANVYKTTLRQVLRGLVPKRRAVSGLPTWKHENLLFICTTTDQHFTLAHFRGEKPERAKLVRFSWSPDEPIRTLCEFNLPALRFPEADLIGVDPSMWLRTWQSAFDVEKVTQSFFEEYKRIFENAEEKISGILKDDKRLFTQKLFNRLLFVRFLEKKGWLSFNGRTDYVKALWDDYQQKREKDDNFYSQRLCTLFFMGLNAPGGVDQIGINRGGTLKGIIGKVPYLNGGLFEQDDTDQDLKIKVPDEAIKPALEELFYRFNFTVTESTPLDMDVAVDPEMLGKIFEELVTGRHDTGSYYTPRTVVSFMCRESLKGYLGGWEKLIDHRDAESISISQAREILDKLAKVKIVDPACGSGAYLIGMLHELHHLTRLLDTRAERDTPRDDYERKLEIIQNNLYGVDMDTFATNIAKLRLWLSLAVEYAGDTPEPLPNLDFKIEIGDSLTAPDPQAIPDIFSQELLKYANILLALKNKHLRSHGNEAKNIKEEILRTEGELEKLYKDNPAPKGSFDWRVRFVEVFNEQGFDVVLANPPYGITCEDPLRFSYFPRIPKQKLKAGEEDQPQSKDSYGLFMARGLQLLKEGGYFSYIVSYTWRTIRTHKPLRKRLLTKQVFHVLDLPPWIFKARVDTCIVSLKNTRPADEHKLVAGDLRNISNGDWDSLEYNLLAVASHAMDVQTLTFARYTYPQKLIKSYDNLSFFIASPELYKRICANIKTILSQYANVVQGISTGQNKFYVKNIDGSEGYDKLNDDNKITDSQFKRLTDDEKRNGIKSDKVKGRTYIPFDKGDVSDSDEGWMPNYYVPTKYYINWSDKSVSRMRTLTIAQRKKSEGKISEIKPGDDKKIAAALRNEDAWFKTYITFAPTGFYSPTFRLGSGTVFQNTASAILLKNLDTFFVLGTLASTHAKYVFKNFLNHTVHTQESDVSDFPIQVTDEKIMSKISSLVSEIINKQQLNQRYDYNNNEQVSIDQLVYDQYGLDSKNIREIELWYCRRYSLLANAQGTIQKVKEKYADFLSRCDVIMSKPPEYWQSHPILQLVAQGESAKLEFKETLEADAKTGEKHPGVLQSALKTIAAFLNADGGTLLIGISDAGDVRGLQKDYALCNKHDKDGLEQKLRSLLASRFQPFPVEHIDIHFEVLSDGEICRIDVKPWPAPEVVHFDKEVYLRDGNVSRKLEGPDLTSWVRRRAQGEV